MDEKFATDHDLSKTVKGRVGTYDFYTTPRFHERYTNGSYEQATINQILRLLAPGDVFMDVGAHHGYMSLKASDKVGPSGRIIALEPDPDNFALLSKNVEENKIKNIMPLHAAVSDKKGKAGFKVSAASDNSSFHKHPNADVLKTVEVDVETIDSLCGFLGVKQIKLIKVDTEGHEIEVVKGAAKTIRSNPSLHLIVELNPKCLESAGHTSAELLDLVIHRGFKLSILDDFGKGERLDADRERINSYVHKYGRANILCALVNKPSQGKVLFNRIFRKA